MYSKPGIIGQTLWFEKILEKSNHPIMLYNIPGRVGIKLYSEVIENLKDHPNLIAIKNSTNIKSAKFFRIINEIPTVILIIVVFLAIFKPI